MRKALLIGLFLLLPAIGEAATPPLWTVSNQYTGRPDYIIRMSSTSIGWLIDVSTTGIADGQCLVWSAANAQLEPGSCGSGGGGGGGSGFLISKSSSVPTAISTMNVVGPFLNYSVTGSTAHLYFDLAAVLNVSSITALGPSIDVSGAEITGFLAAANFPALAGDLSGSNGSLTVAVVNDSHDHTGATLSGIDWADTNLTVSAPLVITTNNLSVLTTSYQEILRSSNTWTGSNLHRSTTTFSGTVFISSGVQLGGSAGTNGQVFTSAGAGTVPSWTTIAGGSVAGSTMAISITYDGGGSAITAGSTVCAVVPFTCTVSSQALISPRESGSASIHISSATFTNFPTLSNMSGFGNGPTLTAAQKNASSTSAWTGTTLAQGDVVCGVLDSSSTTTWLNALLWLVRQ